LLKHEFSSIGVGEATGSFFTTVTDAAEDKHPSFINVEAAGFPTTNKNYNKIIITI
jgi:hypothetical protein